MIQSHPLARDPMRVAGTLDVAADLADAGDRFARMEAEHFASRALAMAFFDRIRDRGLLRRDLNEAFEILTLETLS